MQIFFSSARPYLLVLLAALWLGWAAHLSCGAKPGLLDDGTYIATAQLYEKNGWLNQILYHINTLGTGARFYEVQQSFLGFCCILFGKQLFGWYMTNFVVCLGSAALIYYLVKSSTKENSAAAFAAIFFATASPLADTVRGNFGKAENIMLFFFLAGLATYQLWSEKFQGKDKGVKTQLISGLLLLISLMFLQFGFIAKESGKLLAALLIFWVILSWVLNKKNKITGSVYLAAAGILGILLNYGIASYSAGHEYTKNYFSLNFSPGFLMDSLSIYRDQNPDIIWGALLLLALFVYSLRSRERQRQWSPFVSAVLATAAGYIGLLLAFRFRVSYYLFIPAGLLAVVFGFAYAKADAITRKILLVFLVVSRCYTIPYNNAVGEAQAFFDEVNYKAMEFVSGAGKKGKLVALDVAEDGQLIQEWNDLRQCWFDKETRMLYGGLPFFAASSYMTQVRNNPVEKNIPSANDGGMGGSNETFTPYEIEAGDIIAMREGEIRYKNYSTRAAMPLEMKPADFFTKIVDESSIQYIGEVGGRRKVWRPLLTTTKFHYKWKFYEVVRRPRYLLRGCYPDGWANKDASISVAAESPKTELNLAIETYDWPHLQYPIRLTATMNGEAIASVECPKGGHYEFKIPLDKAGAIKLSSSSWVVPSKVGLSADTRALSYRLLDCNLVFQK